MIPMRKTFPLLLIFIAAVFSLPAGSAPASHFDGKTWWRYVGVLANDNMEGRETGSAGLRRAQAYVVEELKKAGAEPAGSNGYYQPVKFQSREVVEKESSASLVRDGKETPLILGEDGFFSTRVDLAPAVEAPLVFAGYGLRIPENKYDDLDGLDLKNKIAVIISGSPEEITGAMASHYQVAAERWATLRAAGAVGMISIPNPASMDIPWARMSLNRLHPGMDLADPQFDESRGIQLAMTFNPQRAQKLFEGSGHQVADLLALAQQRKPLPRFPLPASFKAKIKTATSVVESANIVATITGSDARLKNEYVVLSAHLDHIGIGEPINGDRIYNGAMDNASGSAVLLDVARSLRAASPRPRRSLIFFFPTAEEKGLLGSKYFTAHPTVNPKAIVADINIDMFLPIVPLRILTVYGVGESDLGDMVRVVARSLNIEVQPDPEPLRNSFIRSDQYNFIRHGIPSLAMKVGALPGSPEAKLFKDWLTLRYHAPADDLAQPVDFAAAAGFEEVIRGLLMAVADSEARPQWELDSFFRRYAAER